MTFLAKFLGVLGSFFAKSKANKRFDNTIIYNLNFNTVYSNSVKFLGRFGTPFYKKGFQNKKICK